MIFIDTETTGFSPTKDDILSMAIVADDGSVLFNEMFRPFRKKKWPHAMAVNGITPDLVRDKPRIIQRLHIILPLLKGQTICCYNSMFDLHMMYGNSILWNSYATGSVCAMEAWAIHMGIPNTKHYHRTGYLTHKLEKAASEIGYEWTGAAHGALPDALACRAVWKYLEQNDSKLIEAILNGKETTHGPKDARPHPQQKLSNQEEEALPAIPHEQLHERTQPRPPGTGGVS